MFPLLCVQSLLCTPSPRASVQLGWWWKAEECRNVEGDDDPGCSPQRSVLWSTQHLVWTQQFPGIYSGEMKFEYMRLSFTQVLVTQLTHEVFGKGWCFGSYNIFKLVNVWFELGKWNAWRIFKCLSDTWACSLLWLIHALIPKVFNLSNQMFVINTCWGLRSVE